MLNLQKARKAMHKTQQDVADYLGISRQAYSNYESGKREPDFETLLKLGEYFDCSVDYLLGNKNDPAQRGEVSDDDIKFAMRNTPGCMYGTAWRRPTRMDTSAADG